MTAENVCDLNPMQICHLWYLQTQRLCDITHMQTSNVILGCVSSLTSENDSSQTEQVQNFSCFNI